MDAIDWQLARSSVLSAVEEAHIVEAAHCAHNGWTRLAQHHREQAGYGQCPDPVIAYWPYGDLPED